MTSDVNYIDIFQFLNWSYKNLSACLSKFGVFVRHWPACFEKASFLFAHWKESMISSLCI